MPRLVLVMSVLCSIAALANEQAPLLSAIALFKNKAVLSVDGKRRTLEVGETTPEGFKLVAADSNSAVIEANGQKIELRLDGRIGANFTAPKSQTLRLVPGEGGHYFVDGTINGNLMAFIVDTGATQIAINKHAAKRLGLLYRTDGKRGQVQTASGHADAYYVRFDSVKVRNLELRNVEGVVVDGDFPTVALLGQSFLNRLDMHRDGVVLELQAR